VKNPDFGNFILLDGINSIYRLINFNKKTIFSFLAAALCPKNLAIARKIALLPDWGVR